MPDYQQIYATEAERYHTLVAAEDYRGELPRALGKLLELEGARVLEVGVGTGRVTRLLLEGGAHVTGYERSGAMLAVARRLLGERFEGHVADVREVELPPHAAHVALAGWVLGHFCEWYAERWQDEIDAVLHKLWRALEPGGTLVVIETLGTGSALPRAPNAGLDAYYRFLEGTWRLEREELQTDYRFASVDAACASMSFFFGPELERQVRQHASRDVPEWTGLWWRRK